MGSNSSKSTITIKLDVDEGAVKTGLAKVKEDFTTATASISRSLSSIKGFVDLKKQTAETAQAYGEVQRKVAALAREVKAGTGGAALARDFERAKGEASRLKEQLAGQQQQLQRVRSAMVAAGQSTAGLAGQQAALREQLVATKRQYQELAKQSMARQTLGITPHAEIAGEVARAREAYATLASSGKLTMAELAQAKVALGTRIDELQAKTNGWRDAMVGVRSGMFEIAAAAAPTVLAIGQAIRFESSMANVKKVVETTPAGFNALRQQLLGLTREIPLTADELANIAAAGGQLGVASADLGQFVTVTAKMATAFDMTAEEAGNAIGKIKNVYQLGIGEVEGFADVINRLGNTTAAREKDIVEVMLQVGGTSRQFGLASESTAALAASMISLGKSPEVASTSINALLNNMQTATMQSKDFHEALGKIGMNAEEMAAAVASNPQKALDDLLATLEKLTGQQRAEVLTGLFGKEFQDDIGVMVGSLKTYRDAMGQVSDKTALAGSMNQEFAARAQTTENQLRLLRNAANEAGINLGSTFLPAVRALLAPITTVIRVLADVTQAAPRLSSALVSIGTGALVFGQVARVANIAKMGILTMTTESGTALQALRTQVVGLKGVLGSLAPAMAALAVGWEIGTWLNQFDIVKKAGITLAHTLTMGWLRVKEAWESMTGGDTGAIRREIDLARQTYAEMIAEIDNKSKQSASTQVQEQKKVTTAAQQAAESQKQVTGEALKAMQEQYKTYADQVKSLQEEITGRQKSLTAELREMGRSGMSDLEAWKDRKKEAGEYFAAAQLAAKQGREALKAGDQATAALKFDEAKQLADDAKNAYKTLNTEVADGNTVLVSRNEALKTAMEGMKQAGELAIGALTAQRDAAASSMEGLVAKSGFADLSAGMDAAKQAWLTNWQNMQAASATAIADVDERIVKMVTPERTVWVNVRTKVLDDAKKILGTEVGEAPTIAQHALGGLIQKLAVGGGVRSILSGGHFPGYGGGDRRLVMAEDGEVMIRKESVRTAGLRAALAFNAGRFDVVLEELSRRTKARIGYHLGGFISSLPEVPAQVQRLATGGPVGGAAAPPATPSRVVELRFAGGQVQGDEQSVEMLLQHLEAAGLSA